MAEATKVELQMARTEMFDRMGDALEALNALVDLEGTYEGQIEWTWLREDHYSISLCVPTINEIILKLQVPADNVMGGDDAETDEQGQDRG